MKKSLAFIFVFFSFSPLYCFTQVLIGVKGGYNFSVPMENSNKNPHKDADLSVEQNSFLVSAYCKSRVSGKIVNWGAEAEYFKTGLSGYQADGGLGAGTIYNYNFTLHFLNLYVKPEFVFGSKWKFTINTGAYFGILLKVFTSGNWQTYGPPPVSSGEIDESINHYFSVINFGFLGGIGTEYPVSNRFLIDLEANYTFGITNLAHNSLSSAFFNLFNVQLSAGLAYKINWTGNPGKKNKKTDWYEE